MTHSVSWFRPVKNLLHPRDYPEVEALSTGDAPRGRLGGRERESVPSLNDGVGGRRESKEGCERVVVEGIVLGEYKVGQDRRGRTSWV